MSSSLGVTETRVDTMEIIIYNPLCLQRLLIATISFNCYCYSIFLLFKFFVPFLFFLVLVGSVSTDRQTRVDYVRANERGITSCLTHNGPFCRRGNYEIITSLCSGHCTTAYVHPYLSCSHGLNQSLTSTSHCSSISHTNYSPPVNLLIYARYYIITPYTHSTVN